MKERFIGIGKAFIYLAMLNFVSWVSNSDTATNLAVGAIMIHFVDREINKD